MTAAAGPVARGRFITLEGGEGAGKSTQLALLARFLEGAGVPLLRTREPGGSTGAEAIRTLILTGAVDRWDARTEALLVAAARRDHVERTIRPALEQGTWVLCDRFFDSTMAYQGIAGGVDPAAITWLRGFATDGLTPDLTILLDLPVEIGIARTAARADGRQRFELREPAFHERLRQAFQAIAAAEPARCRLLDAREGVDALAAAISALVATRFDLPPA
ncbi:dTMP kinase [Stella humosa]|uniref:Thymidylate kinase n=1 Tax=Stella humosa TaxID=94 RepID=A0A3N1MKR6_9PROT|nr:dTMP kinase [Stella humosa]ROQ01586.1 dTMP kinase [Stella humosa]BBK31966.1 thymidylate kinase [Stella humosa]